MIFITVQDLVFTLMVLVVLVFSIWTSTRTILRQRKCKHQPPYNETQACDAICRECGKNLGFIGSVRRATKDQAP